MEATLWNFLGGSVGIGLILVVGRVAFTKLNDNIKDVKEGSMTKTLCTERHNNIESELKRGHERFGTLEKKVDATKEILVELRTDIKYLRENGTK